MSKECSNNAGMRFVYYCSGHGYGHATRVSAFASHLLRLTPKPIVHIVSSAPKLVFADSIALGALYRNAHIDPVIVQPLAYRVDRVRSIEVLKAFLEEAPQKIEDEAQWLRSVKADCVLSDAAFVGCAAANAAGIPSVLVTNFTFDSVYSYLSTSLVDEPVPGAQALDVSPSCIEPKVEPDFPLPQDEVEPLAHELWSGYRCADLLLRLPGAIPIPSFAEQPSLPAPSWVDMNTRAFTGDVTAHLAAPTSDYTLLPQIPFPSSFPSKPLPREVRSAPLLVRSTDPAVYTSEGRSRLLDSIGVPQRLHDSSRTKILIVSFGGQIFHKPPSHSRTHSRSSSCGGNTPNSGILGPSKTVNGVSQQVPAEVKDHKRSLPEEPENAAIGVDALTDALRSNFIKQPNPSTVRLSRAGSLRKQSILVIPGAPPANIPASPVTSTIPVFNTIPPTPQPASGFEDPFDRSIEEQDESDAIGTLVPDESWIAIVCGVSKDWAKEDGEELPENFFVAPKDVYMPDLTAVADVLLGKLGYGTVSECVDACTPFVYVSRPLFIEEHGLRLLLERDGVGVELSRASYEAGDWASAVDEAYMKGKEAKARKRLEGETGRRTAEGKQMAEGLVEWIERWQNGLGSKVGIGLLR